MKKGRKTHKARARRRPYALGEGPTTATTSKSRKRDEQVEDALKYGVIALGVVAAGFGLSELAKNYKRNKNMRIGGSASAKDAFSYSTPVRMVSDQVPAGKVAANTQPASFPLRLSSKGWEVGLLQVALGRKLGDPKFAGYGGIDRVWGNGTQKALQDAGYATTLDYNGLVAILESNGISRTEIKAKAGIPLSSGGYVSPPVIVAPIESKTLPSGGTSNIKTVADLREKLVKQRDVVSGRDIGFLDSEFRLKGYDREVNAYFASRSAPEIKNMAAQYDTHYALQPPNSLLNVMRKYKDVFPTLVARIEAALETGLNGYAGMSGQLRRQRSLMY